MLTATRLHSTDRIAASTIYHEMMVRLRKRDSRVRVRVMVGVRVGVTGIALGMGIELYSQIAIEGRQLLQPAFSDFSISAPF